MPPWLHWWTGSELTELACVLPGVPCMLWGVAGTKVSLDPGRLLPQAGGRAGEAQTAPVDSAGAEGLGTQVCPWERSFTLWASVSL